MSIRLYLDENVDLGLVPLLRAEGLDVESAHSLGMLRRSDEEHLVYATANGRAIVTQDRDYMALATGWASDKRRHAGIIICFRQIGSEIAEMANMILDVCTLYSSLDDLTISLPLAKPP